MTYTASVFRHSKRARFAALAVTIAVATGLTGVAQTGHAPSNATHACGSSICPGG